MNIPDHNLEDTRDPPDQPEEPEEGEEYICPYCHNEGFIHIPHMGWILCSCDY